MKRHSIFLRKDCILPDRLDPLKEPVGKHWMHVEEIPAAVFDTMIRQAGWSSMWMPGACSRRGFGLTREKATHRALVRTLKSVPRQFNAAELDSVRVARYPGFYIANVILHPREIQQRTSLHIVDRQHLQAVTAR